MLLVFLATIAGFIFRPVSLVFAWLAYVLLFYEIKLIHTLAIFPWASLQIEKVSVLFVAFYYIVLFSLIVWVEKLYLKKDNAENQFTDDENYQVKKENEK